MCQQKNKTPHSREDKTRHTDRHEATERRSKDSRHTRYCCRRPDRHVYIRGFTPRTPTFLTGVQCTRFMYGFAHAVTSPRLQHGEGLACSAAVCSCLLGTAFFGFALLDVGLETASSSCSSTSYCCAVTKEIQRATPKRTSANACGKSLYTHARRRAAAGIACAP